MLQNLQDIVGVLMMLGLILLIGRILLPEKPPRRRWRPMLSPALSQEKRTSTKIIL